MKAQFIDRYIRSNKFFSIVAMFAFALWVIWLFVFEWIDRLRLIKKEYIGQWGDTFSPLNALFSIGGFILLLATLRSQQRQIESQNTKNTEESELSFIFRLMSMYQDMRDRISINDGNVRLSGIDAIHQIFFNAKVGHKIKNIDVADPIIDKSVLQEFYTERIKYSYENKLGPYFRLVYTILRRIDAAEIPESLRTELSRLFRAQLTTTELILIALNGLTKDSADLDVFINSHKLLKHFDNENPLYKTLLTHYPVAFEARD